MKTLERWSKEFNWQERIVQRDIEVAKGLEKQQVASIIRTKAKYRKEIRDSLNNPIYRARWTHSRIEGRIPYVVHSRTFNRIQAILKSKRKR